MDQMITNLFFTKCRRGLSGKRIFGKFFNRNRQNVKYKACLPTEISLIFKVRNFVMQHTIAFLF